MHDNPYQPPAPIEATLADASTAESAEDVRRSASLLRVMLALYGVVSVVAIIIAFAAERYLPDDLQFYLEMEAEADLTAGMLAGAVVAVPSLICLLTGWIGMFFFWRPARWLFLVSQCLFFVVLCLFGPYVMHGVEHAVDFASQLVAGAILAMAFFSPARRLFAARSKPL